MENQLTIAKLRKARELLERNDNALRTPTYLSQTLYNLVAATGQDMRGYAVYPDLQQIGRYDPANKQWPGRIPDGTAPSIDHLLADPTDEGQRVMATYKDNQKFIDPVCGGYEDEAARPVCGFCNAKWTDDMIRIFDVDASHGPDSYDFGPEREHAFIDITCSTCERLIYRREHSEYS